jgi:hypothetical protein
MYYHVDYVGAPVSYRWLNVSQIERVWEQMTLTYESGVRGLWILNVGDIKPMELPRASSSTSRGIRRRSPPRTCPRTM